MKTWAADIVRYLLSAMHRFVTGFTPVANTENYLFTALVWIGAVLLKWSKFKTRNLFTLTFNIDNTEPVPVTVGETAFALAVLAWFVVAFSLAAYKFRATPKLSIKKLDGYFDRGGGDVLNTVVEVANSSRKPAMGCTVKIKVTTGDFNGYTACLNWSSHPKEGSATIGDLPERFDVYTFDKKTRKLKVAGCYSDTDYDVPNEPHEVHIVLEGPGIDKIDLRFDYVPPDLPPPEPYRLPQTAEPGESLADHVEQKW